MTLLWKLTDDQGYTGCSIGKPVLWTPGCTHQGRGRTKRMCTSAVIHAYRSPLQAGFMDPEHGEYIERGTFRLLLCEGEVVAEDGTKVGCKKLKALSWEDSTLVTLSPAARVRTAIKFGLMCCAQADWVAWAEKWLSGKDRSEKTARIWTNWDQREDAGVRLAAAAGAAAWNMEEHPLNSAKLTAWAGYQTAEQVGEPFLDLAEMFEGLIAQSIAEES